jgi:hypothetical protein
MCIGQGMILLDVTIVNVALLSIQRELHESSGELDRRRDHRGIRATR